MSATHIQMPNDKLNYWLEKSADREVLFQPINGEVRTYTWSDIKSQAEKIASFLRSKGYVQGDKIAILSKNTAEWFIADLALILGGYISVPIYPTANSDTIKYVLEHSECKAIFIGKLDDYASQIGGMVEGVLRIDMGYTTMEVDTTWEDALKTEPVDLNTSVGPDDVMTILYTSGSTGQPKGALHSYQNFVNCGMHLGKRTSLSSDDRSLSYLPLAHCTERAYVESCFLNYGNQIYFVEELTTFKADLNRCSPTIFGSVPRLWTLFQKGVLENMPQKKLDFMLKVPILSGMVKKKIRQALGFADARIFLSGSAPLSESILEWYKKLDINIGEAWGMTETLAAGSTPRPDRPIKFGTISIPTEGTEVKIAEDGEILIKTDSTMLGYYKDDEKTAETLIDGYVHTGDLGELDSDGYLKITGRKKDIFKTEKGKYVAPVPIEKSFAQNEYIEQMCLMGTTLIQPVLVVSLSPHAKTQDQETVNLSLSETLDTVNESLESHARISHIMVCTKEWTPEDGELTPTLKVKRHVIEKQFIEIAKEKCKSPVRWLD
ncbi:AMP-binding protein [Glaciecola petra]|uniref:AMP-binding protein n=1 Tax=Glaciecola petra TaxID=3075602 RepID=A0ABU2ZR88_9ALTE|nr:AMP-binding protein [Aestuariibacter sp. P117]MDT0595153.1 AMP-binding protein [Aestuariibacter sp. P117]